MRLFQTFVFIFFLISGKSQVSQNIEFEQSKGKWPFPILHFTKFINEEQRTSTVNDFAHKGIIFIPNQIDSVKAVFKGVVITIFPLGDDFVVMTNYGDYFISYVNLDKPTVKKGDLINQGQFLGILSTSPGQLELMLTNRNNKEFDPYEWFNWDAKH
ncbi:MAG TPA: peptidoglycan DD-metalloendopeptidase family protein [Puia sp.]|nr:peptidoglycan DD-metalloendopeptidase family protein [Puia sp.]